MVAGMIARGMVVLTLAALPGPVLAHDGEHVEKRVVKIIRHGDGNKEIVTADAHAMNAKCDGVEKKIDTDVATEKDGKTQRTRIVICGKDDGRTLAALEKARSELAGEDDLGEEHRTRALAALDAEISRLKAQAAPRE